VSRQNSRIIQRLTRSVASMNKSFPVLNSTFEPRRAVGLVSTLAAALTLGGCATYYPDSYPSSGPYYGGGGVGAVYSDR
jgi:hypothetical protein